MTTEARTALLEAMAHFDREIRPTYDFEGSRKYRYFIEHEGRRYPVRKIVARATGRPLDRLRGEEQTTSYVVDHGFKVVDLRPEHTSLQRAFAAFRQDPHDSFMVRIRRTRAEQLRHLLAGPETVTPEVFNREVWRIESATILAGQRVYLAYLWDDLPSLEQIAALEDALEDGTLDLHGNYIWGSGSSVYAPKLKDEQQRSAHIRKALDILNDPALAPIEKAQHLQAIYGFGQNIATGLVMVFHPAEFALLNVQSQDALATLGYEVDSLEDFQEAITHLREELEAEDFLELDLFLYLGNQGRYPLLPASGFWWVNQGHGYEDERSSGYLFAHKKAADGAELRRRDLRVAAVGDIVFHNVNATLRSISRVTAPAEVITSNGAYKGPGGDIAYRLPVTYHDLARPIPLSSIPLEWRTPQAGPFDRKGRVQMGYFMPLAPTFVERMVEHWRNDLPSFLSPTPSIWIFQADPGRYNQGDPHYYDLKQRVREVEIGEEDHWPVTRYGAEMRPGDKVILWQAGHGSSSEDAGIYGFGELGSAPELDPDATAPGEVGEDGSPSEWMVTFLYTRLFPEPIPRSRMREHPVLQQMQILQAPTGTTFKVTQEEWKALQQMISAPPVNPYDTLLQSLAEQGLAFPAELVGNYLLALQTKRFVILTGISGTGKTQIALAVARALQPRVPVGTTRGISDGTVEIKVAPSMLKRHLMTLPAAIAARLDLPQNGTPGAKRQIALAFPGGTTRLSYWEAADRNITQLFFDEPFRAWFSAELKEGDTFLVEVVDRDDGSQELRLSKPAVETRLQKLVNYQLIAVRPDWTDNRGLLGYYNPLLRSYSVTPFLRLLLDAAADVQQARHDGREAYPFFVILDEMNLARVEHYFSDFLSALESGVAIHLHDDPLVEEGENEDAVAVPRELRIPENVFFTGTVNVDETTYMFSPKVLDRAFTIEFNTVDLLSLGRDTASPLAGRGHLALSRFEGKLTGYGLPTSIHWREFGALEGGKLRDTVVALHDLLAADQRHFGYRVANEIARFMLLAREQSDGRPETLSAALDLALLEKVLPKLHGTQQELGSVLVGLFDFTVFGTRRVDLLATDSIEQIWTLRGNSLVAGPAAQGQYQVPVFPRTSAKLWTMLKRLRQQGFASFIV